MCQNCSINIAPAFRGQLTANDLLQPKASMAIGMLKEDMLTKDGMIFSLLSNNYCFTLELNSGCLILTRCHDQIILAPDLTSEPSERFIFVIWTPNRIEITCGHSTDYSAESKDTALIYPPAALIKLAILQKLIPTTHFPSEESLRNAVYEAIADYQDDIRRTGAYNSFWDISYEGKKKVNISPKKEIDIHPMLYLRLREFALMRSIEIVAENKTGIGDVDFNFIGFVENIGPVSICVEVKLAHAEDLIHGLEKQLPAYMAEKQSKYGAYLIFWFKGEWFNRPTTAQIKNMQKQLCADENLLDTDDLKNFELFFILSPAMNPMLEGIRVFIFDVTKPISASKI